MADEQHDVRDEFEREMAHWDAEIAKLGNLARESGADAQLAIENGRRDLRAQVEGARQRREEFAAATDAAWEDAKDQIRMTWEELIEKVKSATSSKSDDL